MTAIAGVSAGANVSSTSPGATAPPTISAMPSAQLDGMQDELAKLYAYMSAMQTEKSKAAQHGVGLARSQERSAQAQRDAELAKAKKAAEERADGGILGWIEEDIGVLGVVGLATFNYGVVAADIALHKTGLMKDAKLDVVDVACANVAFMKPEYLVADVLLRKLDIAPDALKQALGASLPGVSDEDVKPVVAKMVELNLLVAGTATSILTCGSTTALVIALAAAAMSSGALASKELGGPEALTVALTIGGAAASVGGGMYSGFTAAKAGVDTTARIAAANSASHSITGISATIAGVDTVIAGAHEHDFDVHHRNATEARQQIARIQRMLDALIDTLRDGKDEQKRLGEAVNNLVQTHGNSLATAASIRA